jgi:hypothetical protein
VPDHALLRLDVRLELFYFGDQLRFDLLHADQPPDAGTVPSLDTVRRAPHTAKCNPYFAAPPMPRKGPSATLPAKWHPQPKASAEGEGGLVFRTPPNSSYSALAY